MYAHHPVIHHTSKGTTQINASVPPIQSVDQETALIINAYPTVLLTTTTDCTLTAVIVRLMLSVPPNIATTQYVHPHAQLSLLLESTLMDVPALAHQSATQATVSQAFVTPTAQPRQLVLTLTHATAPPTQSVPPTSATTTTANHLACPTKPMVHS